MRITGGILKNRQIKVPPGIIRPSMDKMRESVFGILGDLSGLFFLDLFTGSGIIALEAASRGAEYIEAVEMDHLKRKILLENVKISHKLIKCRFVPVELYVKRSSKAFDIIFCDPPYNYKYKSELIMEICTSKLVKDNTLILLHRPRNEKHELAPCLNLEDYREYGGSCVEFIKFNNHY